MDLPGGLSQLLFPLAPPRLPSTSAPASSSSAQPAAPSLEARLPGTVHLYSNGLRGEKLQLAWMREQVRVRSLAPESRATMEVKQRWRGVRCHPSVQSMHWNPQPNSLVILLHPHARSLHFKHAMAHPRRVRNWHPHPRAHNPTNDYMHPSFPARPRSCFPPSSAARTTASPVHCLSTLVFISPSTQRSERPMMGLGSFQRQPSPDRLRWTWQSTQLHRAARGRRAATWRRLAWRSSTS